MKRCNLLIVLAFWGSMVFADPGAPTGLLCDLLRRPDLCVITNAKPRFGWIVNDAARGAVQAGYQIVVSSKEADAREGKGDLWDSGKVVSADSVAVQYAGKAFSSDTTYYWAVRTWDANDKASPWSAPQRFNVGDLQYKRKWPGESRWVKITGPDGKDLWTFENRHPVLYEEIAPARVVKKAPGQTFVDFGKAAFGTIKLTIKAQADAAVEIHLGEKTGPDQTVDRKPGGSIFYGKYTLNVKQGTQTYTLALPRHVSKYPNSQILAEHMPEVEPFRYAEIIGAIGELEPADIRQVALFYLWDESASKFESSNADLNAVWELCRYTMKASSFMGVYTDGVRERMPYEADALIQQLGHYCTDREYAIARYSHEYLMYHATWPTEWILQSVTMAWNDYLYTGNPDSLIRHYETIKAKALLPLAREDGLISTKTGKLTKAVMDSVHYKGKTLKDIVDWPQPGEVDSYDFKPPVNTVVNAWHHKALYSMHLITNAVLQHGYKPPDQEYGIFCVAAAQCTKAIKNRLKDKQTGLYVDGEGSTHSSLHANAFPLGLGILEDPASRKTIVDFLKTRAMNCGPYGAQFLLEALYNADEGDYALSLLTSKAQRSWLNMIRIGSTMTTESWDPKFKPNLTWNHAWGAAPANLIPRRLMGIEPIKPGFELARINPQPGNLTRAYVKTPTIRGTIEAQWKREDRRITLGLSIPANMRARVVVRGVLATLKESGAPYKSADGVVVVVSGPNVVELEMGGGKYDFEWIE